LAIKNSLTISAIEHIFKFLERKFQVNILRFVSLLILCLEVEVIKRNCRHRHHFKMAKNSKKGKNGKKWPSTSSLKTPTISELEKSLLNKIFCSNITLKMLF